MKLIQNLQPGCVARSCAGRDKDDLMVVLAVDESFVYVADGRHRMVESPKRKNPRHLEIIPDAAVEILPQGQPVSNAALRRALRAIRDNIQTGN